jgi:hypothetical protein
MFYIELRTSTTEYIVHKSKTKSGATRKVNGYINYKSQTRTGKHGQEAVYTILTEEQYEAKYGRMVERINMMSGKPYMERYDTPGYCSPASEAYWSM